MVLKVRNLELNSYFYIYSCLIHISTLISNRYFSLTMLPNRTLNFHSIPTLIQSVLPLIFITLVSGINSYQIIQAKNLEVMRINYSLFFLLRLNSLTVLSVLLLKYAPLISIQFWYSETTSWSITSHPITIITSVLISYLPLLLFSSSLPIQ